jgi:hypothetical protein
MLRLVDHGFQQQRAGRGRFCPADAVAVEAAGDRATPFLRDLAEDAVLHLHRPEQRRSGELRLRLAEEQEPLGIERIMQAGEHDALRLAFQIDQQVTADEQVDARDRRVVHDVMTAEDHAFAQRTVEYVMIVGAFEILVQIGGRHALDVAGAVGRDAGDLQRVLVEVGSIDLHPLAEFQRSQLFGEQHRDREGFFAGCAADAPDPDRPIGFGAGHDRRDHLSLQDLPRFLVAEERGDVDQDGVEQVLELAGIGLELRLVCAEVTRADRLHAQRDAAAQARTLVAPEIEATTFLDVVQERFERGVGAGSFGHGSLALPGFRHFAYSYACGVTGVHSRRSVACRFDRDWRRRSMTRKSLIAFEEAISHRAAN